MTAVARSDELRLWSDMGIPRNLRHLKAAIRDYIDINN